MLPLVVAIRAPHDQRSGLPEVCGSRARVGRVSSGASPSRQIHHAHAPSPRAASWDTSSTVLTTVRAAQFAFIPFSPPSREQIAADNITLTTEQNVTEARCTVANTTGLGFRDMQTNKPNDVGLSLYDNPVGQVDGRKNQALSDLRAGTPSSQLNSTANLTLIPLYYLTDSFLSSLWIYVVNPESFSSVYTNKASSMDAPMLFSQYKYNVAYWPEEFVAKVGNFVSYISALRSS
ncbi:hypothetical protein DFH08DRAFT_1084728 [Mycena albidolilacea]|uniref:Uncharacterized protein n=1 Tax=Mycena albidolilacea TaxID=1033008 RepID=A0AAD6ZKN4_9AGAR|nr:hypothetical protein DFH08DRAFT_1084728 [Mycena albidolilacea]